MVCMDDRASGREQIEGLAAKGHHVTLVLMDDVDRGMEGVSLALDVELADANTESHYVFRELAPACDVLWIRGAGAMRGFLRRMWNVYDCIPPIVYEVEAIGEQSSEADLEDGTALCEAADVVVVRSDREAQLLRERGIRDVRVSPPDDIEQLLVDVGTAMARA